MQLCVILHKIHLWFRAVVWGSRDLDLRTIYYFRHILPLRSQRSFSRRTDRFDPARTCAAVHVD